MPGGSTGQWREREQALAYYFDDDSTDDAVVRGLKGLGIDAVTSDECNNRGLRDDAHLEFAATVGRVLVTANIRDYMAIHSAWWEAQRIHAGIVLVRQQRWNVGERVRRLARMAREVSPAEMRGRVEFLSRW